MTESVDRPPALEARFWRSRSAASIAGIIFAVLFITALVMIRLALGRENLDSLISDPSRQKWIKASLSLMPFAGIAFLWFIGVVRERLGDSEDRLFSTVFLGSGLLFLALMFVATVMATSLLEMLATPKVNVDVWLFGRDTVHTIVSVYAMRMAAVFMLSVSTVALRTRSLPRWIVFVGYLVALALLLTSQRSDWTTLLFPAWVLLISIALLVVARTRHHAASA